MIIFFFCLSGVEGRLFFFFFQAADGIRDGHVTGVQTCALPIWVRDEGRERPERRVIDDEGQVGEVLGGALEIARMEVLLDAVREWQSLVQADVPDPETPRGLEHRVRDLLVVDAPR